MFYMFIRKIKMVFNIITYCDKLIVFQLYNVTHLNIHPFFSPQPVWNHDMNYNSSNSVWKIHTENTQYIIKSYKQRSDAYSPSMSTSIFLLLTCLSFLCLVCEHGNKITSENNGQANTLLSVLDIKWWVSELTMSSERSLARVIDNTSSRGTTVVNQDRDEIWGISCLTQTWRRLLKMYPNWWHPLWRDLRYFNNVVTIITIV